MLRPCCAALASNYASTYAQHSAAEKAEGKMIGIGAVAQGIHCSECNALCDNDSVLFHHIRENHPEKMFEAQEDGPSISRSGALSSVSLVAACKTRCILASLKIPFVDSQSRRVAPTFVALLSFSM